MELLDLFRGSNAPLIGESVGPIEIVKPPRVNKPGTQKRRKARKARTAARRHNRKR